MPKQNTLAKFLDELDQTQQSFFDILDQVNEDTFVEHDRAHVGQARAFLADQ